MLKIMNIEELYNTKHTNERASTANSLLCTGLLLSVHVIVCLSSPVPPLAQANHSQT